MTRPQRAHHAAGHRLPTRRLRCRSALRHVVFAALVPLVTVAPGAIAQSRLALVIGNGEYAAPDHLDNPLRDAADMARTLRGLGFRVFEAANLSGGEMRSLVARFYEAAAADRVDGTFFYFAGHGKQVQGINLLLPVDTSIAGASNRDGAQRLLERATRLDDVVARAARTGRGWHLIVVDACRDEPRATRGVGGGHGFAPAAAARGTLVAFSTAPGALAREGPPGGNGLYTRHLLRHLGARGLPIEQVFKRVRADVIAATGAGGAAPQVPWESTSLVGELVLAPR